MEQQLKELLVERLFLDLDPSEIETDTALAEYGIDSFLLLELIVAIEEIFGVKFGQEDINTETLRSIGTLRDCIVAKQG
jgi:acyl carrier protein